MKGVPRSHGEWIRVIQINVLLGHLAFNRALASMQKSLVTQLGKTKSLQLEPRPPYNFDTNFHKPSHFPSSNCMWEAGMYHTTMLWQGWVLGLRFDNKGTIAKPRIRMSVYSEKRSLPAEYSESLKEEIGRRFNFYQDISSFTKQYENDKFLGQPILRWKGMKPIAGNSLYELNVIYIVLQNATVRRSVQMLQNLFVRFGRQVSFDGRTLSVFWNPGSIARSNEDELRTLKVGYRAKALMKISEQFANETVDEFGLRKLSHVEDVRREMDKLYGIGPASLDGLAFEYFYFLDALNTIPPWEQKIMSRLLFHKHSVPAEKILNFFSKHWRGYEKLAFHYLWEDLFWRRKLGERIDWLEKEIRL